MSKNTPQVFKEGLESKLRKMSMQLEATGKYKNHQDENQIDV